jgi:opacity protein-like surface antigen
LNTAAKYRTPRARSLFSVAVATALAITLCGGARAQQLGPVTPWTGPSVGIAGLGGWSTSSNTEVQSATGAVFRRFETLGGGAGGAFDFGYDWPAGDGRLLIGGVGEIGFLSDQGGHVLQTTTGPMGLALLRAGVSPLPAMLLYGATGVAVAGQSARINFGGPITQQNRATPGATLGAGGEYAIGAAPALYGKPVSLFAEYQHVWWDRDTIDMPAAVPTLNLRWQRQTNIVRAGVRLGF